MANEQEQLLIISGSEKDREFLTHCLEEAGYPIVVAADGNQGFEVMQTQKPDVVLLDLHITGLSAEQFVNKVVQDKSLRIIPVILLAAAQDMEVVERCLALGADDYLVRPFSPTLLKSQVREFQEIRKRRLKAQEESRKRLQEKIEHDVEIARDIQLSFLPRELPQPEGWNIAAYFAPTREVAGDFYDAFAMAQGRRIGFVIADVCDKGVGAALFMALTRSLTRAFAQQNYSLNLMGGIGDDLPAAGGRRKGLPFRGDHVFAECRSAYQCLHYDQSL